MVYKHNQLIVLIEVCMEIKSKPHLKLTPQGWHAKVNHSFFGFQSQANALGETPSKAMKNLNEFLIKLKG